MVHASLPSRVRSLTTRFRAWPAVGFVRFGSFRRVTPIAPIWPARHDRPVDRVYIEDFVARHAADIQGEVLEVGGLEYTGRFGGDRVTGSSILHSPIGAGPLVTYAADLVEAPEIPSDHFDCIVLPQTLLFIYDVAAAVRTLHRILRPGGVVLVTVPGITQIVPDDQARWGQYWSFTIQSLERLFGDVFGPEHSEIESRGNVKTTVSLLHGLATADLRSADFDDDDPNFPLILTVRGVKAG